MSTPLPAIPYGRGHFKGLRLDGCLYVDKTRFLHALERERYVFFIRPRRFGKTCWLSLLESYYDRNEAEAFDAVFGGTDAARRPTAGRSRYVVLRFNFSGLDVPPDALPARFEDYCGIELRRALRRNRDLFPEDAVRDVLAHGSVDARLRELFEIAAERGVPLYVLIDEYDNFANTVLAHHGTEAYQALTHGGGFYRNFFATLKAGADAGGLERLFVTGVSPITMDDVTSGFNIGANVSLDPEFNELLGFTEAEVRGLLERYRELGAFDQDVDEALDVMREWYDGYRFAEDAETTLYNTDMVLYYLKHSVPNRRGPRELIDVNVRIDYGKLRHLLVTGRRLNGNFDLLREVIGEGQVSSELRGSFPLERLTQRENFLSLLHYLGLLSIRGVTAAGTPRLGVPNQTVRQLTYGYLRDGYEDVGVFAVDLYELERLTHRMAYEGDWRPVLEFLRDAVARQTGIRDYLSGEKVVQGFLAAYLNVTSCFVFHSERELGGGYADICLEPLLARHPGVRHGYVIELKYLKRGEGDAGARVEAAVREAAAQLRRYLADERLARQYPEARFTGLAVVFHGWEMARCEAVQVPRG